MRVCRLLLNVRRETQACSSHTKELHSDEHFAHDQAVWVGAKDRRKTSRKERAGASLHQDTSDLELDQRTHQVGVISDLSCIFVLRSLSSYLIPVVTVCQLIFPDDFLLTNSLKMIVTYVTFVCKLGSFAPNGELMCFIDRCHEATPYPWVPYKCPPGVAMLTLPLASAVFSSMAGQFDRFLTV
jgi:hypothetical protein